MSISLTNSLPDQPAIVVRDVTKIFHLSVPGVPWSLFRLSHAKPVVALNNVSLTINQGEIFGLVGRNGQGKTTLIKCIASLLQPTQGSISIFGHDTNQAGDTVRGLIGLVSADDRTFYGRLTGWQNLMFFARLYGLQDGRARRRIQELAEIFGFLLLLHRRYQELSSGNKQRMALIRALLIDPPVLLLDEPTRSLDPIAADELRQIVLDLSMIYGKTIFITSHNLAEVENLCTRVGFLGGGEIKLCATMQELSERYFDIERVTLSVRGIPDLDVIACLDFQPPALEVSRTAPDLIMVRFRRKSNDDALDRMIRTMLDHSGAIVACRTDRDGLREIMDTLETRDRSLGYEAVADGN